MNREALIAELNWLLDAGEPLLTAFPRQYPDMKDRKLELPDNISDEMRWYADGVAFRATWDREHYQCYLKQEAVVHIARMVGGFNAGLSGWRAIGVLK